MKKIKYLFALPAFLLCSCNDFMDIETEQNFPTEDAYKTVQDVQNGLNGMYYALGHYTFYGRNVVALGDMAADNAVASASTGHFLSLNRYNFSDTEAQLDNIWVGGYRVMDRATRTIQGAYGLIDKVETLHLSENELANLHSFISQSYAVRALAAHRLVTIFGLPYRNTRVNSQLGIVLMDKEPIPSFTQVARATVEETYARILADIAAAKATYAYVDNYNAGVNEDGRILMNQYYMNKAAMYGVEARVALFMQNYNQAILAADSALILRNANPVTDETYLKMWSSTAITDEDIFTLAKSEDDNLSANSLNTLYGSYRGAVTNSLIAQFHPADIRLKLISGTHPKKFDGIPTSQAVNNIPVFRVSEMHLILAEAYAHTGDLVKAKEHLFFTAKRNTALTENDLPATQTELLDFIAQERRRELFEEGFRWFDARRTGERIDVSNGAYRDFDVAAFVYPIPASEINAGFGVEQNKGWENAMPE